MFLSKKAYLFIISVFILIILSLYISVQIQRQKGQVFSSDPRFSEWLPWKAQTNLTEKQKSVLDSLEKSSTIYSKAFNTRCVQLGSRYGHPNPKEAIAITERAIKDLKELFCPKECIPYRDTCIKIMEDIIIYHRLRLAFKEGTGEFTLRYNKFQLYEIKNGFNVNRYNAFFEALNKVGLLDNIEQEMKKLNLKDGTATSFGHKW